MTPTEHDLQFARLIILEKDLAEVIVNEDIEITLDNIYRLRKVLGELLIAPHYLIINKLNHYSYEFNAQLEIGKSEKLKATAIICYSDSARQTTSFLSNITKDKKWNMEIFSNKEDAINWLISEKNANNTG